MSEALFAAVRADDAAALAAALASEADPDVARDRYGRTALHVAVKTGRPACIAALIAAAADPMRTDPRGSSPLDAALEEGDPALFAAMASAGRPIPTLPRTRRLAIAARAPSLARWLLQPGEAPSPASAAEKELVDAWDSDEASAPGVLPEHASSGLLHLIVDRHNWDSHNDLVVQVVTHPLCAPLTARLAYDRAELREYDPSAPIPEWQRPAVRWRADLHAALRARFSDVLDP